MLKLSGTITVARRLADHWVWQREPLCAMGAWVDLLMLARQERGEITVNGHQVILERGDVGFAIHNLAERWRRSREWTTKFLRDCAERRMIEMVPVEPGAPRRGTIIRITNYGTYNTDHMDNRIDTNANNNLGNRVDINREGGSGSTEQGSGEGPSGVANFPEISQAVTYFQKVGADYTAEEIRSAWHELAAGAVDGQWVTGRIPRPVADWRSALESELWKRRQIYGEKKTARGGEARIDGEPPLQAAATVLTLEMMRIEKQKYD